MRSLFGIMGERSHLVEMRVCDSASADLSVRYFGDDRERSLFGDVRSQIAHKNFCGYNY
ncbi:hypothetical protein ACSQ6I_20070 [Anabaena sp. WFMT]|uniref:hypothetical protein n=1 Tax=Anabaena sp. WFMT TaxID=3449730 RepID=UPI003F29DAF0